MITRKKPFFRSLLRHCTLIAALLAVFFTVCACVSPLDEEQDEIVTITAIKGVVVPVAGETPVAAITPTAQYTGSVVWTPADEFFAAGTSYTAVITLTPTEGYTITGVAANAFTVAGAEAVNAADSGVVTAVFPATPKAAETSEDLDDFGADAVINNTFTVRNEDEWNSALAVIKDGGNGKNYIINIADDFEVAGVTSSIFGSVTELTVSIRGEHTLTLKSDGSALRITTGQRAIVRDVDFAGKDNNTNALVHVWVGSLALKGNASVKGNTTNTGTGYGGGAHIAGAGGTLLMKDDALVSGNTTTQFGGGVHVTDGAAFTMEGNAKVSGNNAVGTSGGGVHVSDAEFIMQGNSKVYENTVTTNAVKDYPEGGGVNVWNGTFTMKDSAEVYGNTVESYGGGGIHISGKDDAIAATVFTMEGNAKVYDNSAKNGGGVHVYTATLVLKGNARIEGNSAQSGGGVWVEQNSNFTMDENALITKNESTEFSGGGVYLLNGSEFTMQGKAVITLNTSAMSGGGAYINGSKFTMAGNAVVSENTAQYGGGAYIDKNSSFTMDESTLVTNNESTTGGGGGVYILDGSEFTMQGNAKITLNTTASSGGGVFVLRDSKFTMTGEAVISKNSISELSSRGFAGGGVSVDQSEFTMAGRAVISGNSAPYGGGVQVINAGTFNMRDTTIISSNSALHSGGGVGVRGGQNGLSTFNIEGGTIYGSGDGELNNNSANGAALFVAPDGIAQYGTFDANGIFTGSGYDLSTSNDYIWVENGQLLE